MSNPQSDHELLRAYVEVGSEPAFTELVQRYVGMVHASALRQTGRSDLAEEVVQAVFILLARKAETFDDQVLLGGWLFRSVRFAASDLLKAERRRQFRETVAYSMKAQEDALDPISCAGPSATTDSWTHIAPELDGCLAQLGETDRAAILLRFFEEKSFPEVGTALRLTEEAARKRVTRAMGKLQTLLVHRGVTASVLGLGSLLSTQAAANTAQAAVPVGLGLKAATVALAAKSSAAWATPAAALAKSVGHHWLWVQLKPWLFGAAALITAGTMTAALVDLSGRIRQPSVRATPMRADYRSAGFPDADRVHAVIGELQAAVARGDVDAVATRVRFPFRLNTGSEARVIPDATAFSASYAAIFTPEIRATLAKCPRAALFSNLKGVMIGSGDLWLAPVSPDNPEPRLAAINLKATGR